MPKSNNVVVAGDYLGYEVRAIGAGQVVISAGIENIPLTRETVAKHEVMSRNTSKSTGSAVKRAVVGKAVMGRGGMVLGAATARRDSTFEVAIDFKDGKRSKLQIDEGTYKALQNSLF